MVDMIAADFGIRQLHARFADAAWRQDAESFSGCFAVDGVWKIAGQVFTGREAIAGACGNLLGRCSHVHIMAGLPMLHAEGEEVLGRLSMTEFARMHDGSTAMSLGWYHDRYCQEDGVWKFKKRHWAFKYRGAPDLTGFYPETPNYGVFPSAPSDDEPTYVRPAT
mgnify:CR=1 FL=1